MAERIRLSNQKGVRLPDGAVFVGGNSDWSNTWRTGRMRDLYAGNARYVASLDRPDTWVAYKVDRRGNRTGMMFAGHADRLAAERFAVDLFDRSLAATRASLDGALDLAFYLRDIVGHDLACTCRLTDDKGNRWPCHAEVLLDWAARPDTLEIIEQYIN